jgi:hypothetical protein
MHARFDVMTSENITLLPRNCALPDMILQPVLPLNRPGLVANFMKADVLPVLVPFISERTHFGDVRALLCADAPAVTISAVKIPINNDENMFFISLAPRK